MPQPLLCMILRDVPMRARHHVRSRRRFSAAAAHS